MLTVESTNIDELGNHPHRGEGRNTAAAFQALRREVPFRQAIQHPKSSFSSPLNRSICWALDQRTFLPHCYPFQSRWTTYPFISRSLTLSMTLKAF